MPLIENIILQPFPNILTEDREPKDIFSTQGETWRKLRRTLSPSFSTSKMKMVHLVTLLSNLHIIYSGHCVRQPPPP